MGFKINYHAEIVLFLCTMFMLIVPMSLPAKANIPEKAKKEFLTAPLPQLNIPTLKEPSIPEIDHNELRCLAEAVYFESKNESLRGQRAVAHVIINRTKSSKFPETICSVINQKYKSTCQFSYKCDGASDIPNNKNNFATAVKIAKDILEGERDNTNGALFFHNNTVRPLWAKTSKMTTIIGNHKFYRG